MPSPEVRRCRKCKKLLNISEFRLRSGPQAEKAGRAGQPYGRCKSCTRKYTIEKTDGDLPHALRSLLWRTGTRDKKVHSREALTPEILYELYTKQNGRCAISGKMLTAKRGVGRVAANVSLDRIDNSLGYTRENIQLAALKANEMKGDGTEEQLLDYCVSIIETIGRPKKK